MNKLSVITHSFFALLCAISITSTSFAEPANLSLLAHEVKAYHDSGEYEKEITAVIKKARAYINARAKKNARSPHPQKLAIVLDIDETSVSNYHYMLARQFIATKEQLHNEINNADSPAIKPIIPLYQDALKQDVSVFFITGREESLREATKKNLKRRGFHIYSGLYLKPNDYNKKSIIPFKSKAREMIERKGYHIIATIGDQCSDIRGGFAEKGFKVPNPYYYLP